MTRHSFSESKVAPPVSWIPTGAFFFDYGIIYYFGHIFSVGKGGNYFFFLVKLSKIPPEKQYWQGFPHMHNHKTKDIEMLTIRFPVNGISNIGQPVSCFLIIKMRRYGKGYFCNFFIFIINSRVLRFRNL